MALHIDQIRDYCLAKQQVTESFPFDEDTLVFKVANKMFLLISLKRWEQGDGFINLKCDPDWAQELRAEYESIQPGYHMHKCLWNSVYAQTGKLSPQFVNELIDHSYEQVVKSLPKKLRATINL
ncbi:MmcQ/YjbR family DNA-binding protein [Winogradskyella aurantiaca]|uniref:MmcQ/YjbR family DNA-binding protein n=1 Tax=Winogradskyella aurantiaca TaxID=2219558 RepID=UPI000E1D9E18|nr:MmcQ/YjbR family DNA-binding protein [Winogradskyella aurantiaca]